MSAHIGGTHKIPQTDKNYKHYVESCEVIPSCHITFKEGVPCKLSEAEIALDEDNEDNEDKLEAQYATNRKLKELRGKINLINKEMADQSTNEELKRESEKLQKEYISVRYKDLRNYPQKLKVWKDSFASYIEHSNNSSNAEKVACAAVDINLNYASVTTDIELDLKFLLNGQALNEMLILLKSRLDLATSTKIKYLSYYKTFLNYICKNPTSPEAKHYEDCNSLLFNTTKVTQLESVISDYKDGFILSNKRENAVKMQKKRRKFYLPKKLSRYRIRLREIAIK